MLPVCGAIDMFLVYLPHGPETTAQRILFKFPGLSGSCNVQQLIIINLICICSKF
jgi:hypothetical protein